MNQAEGWNRAYTKGTLRRKRDMDYIMPSPTDIGDMVPDEIDHEGKVVVGVLIVVCILVVSGFALVGWLS